MERYARGQCAVIMAVGAQEKDAQTVTDDENRV